MAEILVAASTEMAEAAARYDDRVAGLGERFLLEAEAAFARIDENPLTGSWSMRRARVRANSVTTAHAARLSAKSHA